MKFPTPVGVGCVRGCQYDSRDCYNKTIRSAVKRGKVENPRDEEMLDFDEESARETLRSFRPIRFSKQTVNMILIEEIQEEESPGENEKRGTLSANQIMTMVPYTKAQNYGPQVLMVAGPNSASQHEQYQEGIVEEVSDKETNQYTTQDRKGKGEEKGVGTRRREPYINVTNMCSRGTHIHS